MDLKRIELVQIEWFTTKAQSGCHDCKQGEEPTVGYLGSDTNWKWDHFSITVKSNRLF